MIRTIFGDPERFKKSYYPAGLQGPVYLAGDGAIRDAATGNFTITGRIDDVLNVSGHRMGTMEIESALVSCTELVAEAAVVGRPDDVTGEAVCAFVVLKRPRPTGEEAKADRCRTAQPRRQGDRPDRQAQGHPLRRQPAQDPLRKDHAPAAAFGCQGRADQPGHLDAGKPGHPGAAGPEELTPIN
ncbi:MAG: hypothetical protein QM765_11590 [Myxococcales bacterium]